MQSSSYSIVWLGLKIWNVLHARPSIPPKLQWLCACADSDLPAQPPDAAAASLIKALPGAQLDRHTSDTSNNHCCVLQAIWQCNAAWQAAASLETSVCDSGPHWSDSSQQVSCIEPSQMQQGSKYRYVTTAEGGGGCSSGPATPASSLGKANM